MKTYSLTIKHVQEWGHIDLYAAERVGFNPSNAPGQAGIPDTVYADLETGETRAFDRGTIYVMNSSGRTVQTFHLATDGPRLADNSGRTIMTGEAWTA